MTKYRELYERYRSLIMSGLIVPGERLPSIRAAAGAEGVGLNTVKAAWDLLEGESLVVARERGGYFVRGNRAIPACPAAPAAHRVQGLSAFEKISYLQTRAGSDGADFSLALPDPDLLPLSRLAKLLAAGAERSLGYGDPCGEMDLRRRIASRYAAYHGELDPAEIVVTNGATEALSLAVAAVVRRGDRVLVESPAYFEFHRILAMAGAEIVEIPVRPGTGLDLDILESELESAPARAILVQPNVQNPTGASMSEADKRRLVDLASVHGATLIQDDVYGDLSFSSERGRNLSAFGARDIVYLSSFSKTLSVGLRVGWLHVPGRARVFARLKAMRSLGTNVPAQRAIADFLEGRAFERHLAAMREALRLRLEDHLDFLEGALPSGASMASPGGGCLLWLALPPGSDASLLFERAAAEGILFSPGELFSANPFHRRFLRLNAGRRLDEPRRRELARLCALARDRRA